MFADVFSDVMIESRHGYTCVMATVRDASEFYGLLERFQDLALQPVSINEIGPSGVSADEIAAFADADGEMAGTGLSPVPATSGNADPMTFPSPPPGSPP